MKTYIIKRGGVELTVKLKEETAKRLGAKPVSEPQAEPKKAAPRNKSKTPQDK